MTQNQDANAPSDAIRFLWDPRRLRIVEASPPALAFFGALSAEALALIDFPSEDSMALALASGRDEVSFTVLRDDDMVRVRARIEPGHTSGGKPVLSVTLLETPNAPHDAALADRAAALLEAAPTPIAAFEADGDPLWRNAAAERLFGPEPKRFDALFAAADLGASLRRAAIASGAARRVGALLAADGVERRAVACARIVGPSGDWELVATFPSAVGVGVDPSRAAPLGAREPSYWRALAVFDAGDLRLRAVNQAAAACFDRAGVDRSAATLESLFPDHAEAVSAALAALAAEPAQAVELSLGLEGAAPPGPWLKAALWRARAGARDLLALEPAQPATAPRAAGEDLVALAFVDLSAERRSLVRLTLEAEERGAALAALGVGQASLDETGAIREISEAGARLIGGPDVEPDALIGALFAERLEAGAARRLARYLADGPVIEGRAFEDGLDAGLVEPDLGAIRMALSPPSRRNRGRRAVAFRLADQAAPLAAREVRAATPGALRGGGRGHALRTELTTIRGFAELLDRALAERGISSAADPLPSAYLSDIADSVDRIVALLDGGSPDAPTPAALDPAWEDVDLPRFLRATLDAMSVGLPPAEMPNVTVLPVVGAVAAPVKSRAALRELIETAASLAPPVGRERLKITAAPDGAFAATLTLEGLSAPLDDAAARFALRLIEMLADRAGAGLTRETASRLRFRFAGPDQE